MTTSTMNATTPVFKISDLTAKRISLAGGFAFGSVANLTPDQDPDDFTPISPWVMFGKVIDRLDFIDRFDEVARIDIEALDKVALDVGRHVVSGKFFPGGMQETPASSTRTAQCFSDMPTCARNQQISPLASMAETITNIDLGRLRDQLHLAIERIDRFEKKFD